MSSTNSEPDDFPKPTDELPFKLELKGDGNTLSVTFTPDGTATQDHDWPDPHRWPMGGSAECHITEKGSGVFLSQHGVIGLRGTYRLQVGNETARLFQKEEQIWFGAGKQNGLDGQYEIEIK